MKCMIRKLGKKFGKEGDGRDGGGGRGGKEIG